MPIQPRPGRARWHRQRKSWSSSSAEGCLNDRTSTACGLTPLITCLIVPSLPAASMPCSTSSTPNVSWAASRSWYSASSSTLWASRPAACGRVTGPVYPGSWSRLSLTSLPGGTRSGAMRSVMKRRRLSMSVIPPRPARAHHRGRPKLSPMWNSFRTDARTGLTAEVINIPGGNGDEIHAWFARPTGDAPAPGIVAVHHLPGWDEFYREFCERLARHGYSVLCPDLYCRYGHGTPDDIAAAVRAEGGVPDDSVVADCAAALGWLKALPTSNGQAGIIGTCSGGRHALLAASRVPSFDAVADLWGGGVVMSEDELSPARPVAPIDYTA